MSVVVSGAGAACAVGTGCDALWEALSAGRDGLFPVKRFSVDAFDAKVAGLWPGWAAPPPKGRAALELARVAAREAVVRARVADLSRMAVIVGTCFAEDLVGFSELATRLAAELGAAGPAFIVSTACSSSTTAVGLGRDLLERGEADVVLAGGVDVITREVFAGFYGLGVMAKEKCAPFGEPLGLNLGEGAGFVVLEREESLKGRGVEPLAHVLGYGLSCDAHHETAPDPTGSGVRRAVAAALEDAGGGSIDFVSAHGTGTDSNDAAEWKGLMPTAPSPPVGERAGVRGSTTPISSTKSFLGHAQGAAGVLELISLLLCMKRGLIPPTLRANPRRPAVPEDVVAQDRPRPHHVQRALKVSAAFGGANAALIVGREAALRTPHPRRRVFISGLATVGPEFAALESGSTFSGAVAPFDLGAIVRSAPDRDVDPSIRFCTAGVALALKDAGLTVRGPMRERSGIFCAGTHMPAQSVSDTWSSIERRGVLGLAPVPFTHMVLNAPAGKAAQLLSLKGPLLALAAAQAGGLFAIVRAAEHLAARRDADLIVAGAIDERPAARAPGAETEGAAFVALRCEGDGPELLGWGVAGPRSLDDAVRAAMSRSPEVDGVVSTMPFDGLRTPLGVTDVSRLVPGAEAMLSALALVLAAARIRRGAARKLLVISACDSLACAAVVGGSNER